MWVEHVLKNRDRTIGRYQKKINKFGLDLAKTMEEALALDAKNENTLWAEAISDEMENFRLAFKVLPDEKSVPIDHPFVFAIWYSIWKTSDIRPGLWQEAT